MIKLLNFKKMLIIIFPNLSSDYILNIKNLEYKSFEINKHTIGLVGNISSMF